MAQKPAPLVFVLGLVFFVLGLVFFVLSLLVASNLASATLGILGMTIIWDGTELYRQEDRIRRGHAPANLDRPVEPRRE
jgi:hypothetical protein